MERPTPAEHFGIPHTYAQGAFAPVYEERTSWFLPIEGSVPDELNGVFLRNGPNPPPVDYEGPYHWFVPDGMLHGVKLQGGRAVWYRNRWVRTEALADKLATCRPGGPEDVAYAPNTSNTSVVGHAGKVLSLAEYGLPYQVTPELETIGRYDFDGDLRAPMTAHPKVDPVSGEMFLISFMPFPPYLRYHVIDPAGRLTRTEVIDVPAPTLMHDWAMTADHVLFFDLPVVFDADHFIASGFPYRWDEDHNARIGVMPKTGSSAQVRWFEIEPCYFVHSTNAYESGTTIVLEAPRYPTFMEPGKTDILAQGVRSELFRWTVDLADGSVAETPLDDHLVEFPRINEALTGREHRVSYAIGGAYRGEVVSFESLVKHDGGSGSTSVLELGAGHVPSEAIFVPAAQGKAEDEGWLLSFVYDPARDASDLVIVDAGDFGSGPQAVVRLPARVPFGFHGTWLPADPS